MKERLVEIVDDFEDKKILVIGDIMLDEFIRGKCERVNPEEEGAPLVGSCKRDYLLGGAGNVAKNITSLGGQCNLWGCFGEDYHGTKVKKLCEENFINLKNFYDEAPTMVKTRVIGGRRQVVRYDFGETDLKKISSEVERKILAELQRTIDEHDFIVLSDYNKSVFTRGLSYNIVGLAKQKGIGTLADAKPENAEYFKGCTIICPNKHEAEKITGVAYSNGNGALKKMGENLIDKMKSQYVLITCGEDGAFLYGDNGFGEGRKIPTRAKAIADVTGAGDTFAATLALGMASGVKDIEHLAEVANYASGVVVEKIGTAATTPEELKEYIQKEQE